jgi:hypothetical protein
MSLRKLLNWLICLLLFAQSGLSVTPAEIDANNQDAKLRAMIEAGFPGCDKSQLAKAESQASDRIAFA